VAIEWWIGPFPRPLMACSCFAACSALELNRQGCRPRLHTPVDVGGEPPISGITPAGLP